MSPHVWAEPAVPTALSGVYTPTLTDAGTNIAAATPREAQFGRVQDFVTVAGSVNIDVVAVASTQFFLTLPVASVFTNAFQLAGVMKNSGSGVVVGSITAWAPLGRLLVTFTPSLTTPVEYVYHYSYRVLS